MGEARPDWLPDWANPLWDPGKGLIPVGPLLLTDPWTPPFLAFLGD